MKKVKTKIANGSGLAMMPEHLRLSKKVQTRDRVASERVMHFAECMDEHARGDVVVLNGMTKEERDKALYGESSLLPSEC